MKKLYEISGQKLLKGDVGIEIEVEGAKLKMVDNGIWYSKPDGSLRGENQEYILRTPIPIGDVEAAMKGLNKELKDFGSKLSFSFRTSVHVHVNCQELEYKQYLNYLYTYLLLEEPLMQYCGKERKGNRFCLRLQDAEGITDALQKLFGTATEWTPLWEIAPDTIRYSAMNVEATKKYGSLEFRAMKGTLDVTHITTWCQALVNLREFSKTIDSPVDVYNMFIDMGPMKFMQHVFGENVKLFEYPRMISDVQRSFSLSLELPFSIRKMEEKAAAVKTVVPRPFQEFIIPAAPVRKFRFLELPRGWHLNADDIKFYKGKPVARDENNMVNVIPDDYLEPV